MRSVRRRVPDNGLQRSVRGFHLLSCTACIAVLLFSLPSRVQGSEAPEPIEVGAALQLDQVTGVDQKAENFSIVGTFIMSWKDEDFAFDPDECGCEEKLFNTAQFEEWTRENELIWPRFLFYNQQGNRWIQEDVFVVTAVTVIANVVMKRLSVSGKEGVARRWDGTILWGYPVFYAIGFGLSYWKFFT